MTRLATITIVALLVPASAFADGVFQVGAGYGPDDGFIASTSIANDNLFHTGSKLAMSSSISKIRQRFAIEGAVPLADDLELTGGLIYERRQLPGFVRESVGGSVGFSQRIDRATRVYINYRLEHVAALAGDGALERSTLPPSADNANTIGALGAGIVRDTTTEAIPRSGSRMQLYVEGADRALGSDVDMWRASARFGRARTYGGFLTLRGSVRGSIVGGDVPKTEKLYFLGNSDLRGYALGDITAGSTKQAIGRFEAEVAIGHGLSVAGFVDAGLADDGLHRAVGYSVIWRSPIGPLRFDWALPLDGAERDHKFLFSFGAGF